MALFDFFRRRKDRDPQPAKRTSGFKGFFSRLFNRRKPAAVPEPEEDLETAVMEDVQIDDDLINNAEDVYLDTVPAVETGTVPTLEEDSQYLLNKYEGMLDTMVERGYIQPFDSDQDAAEFLRVLGSEAWEEAHAYWYSVEALQQIQDAISRGATAGSLQEDYNMQREKKSNNYLKTWEDWIRVEG